LKRTEPLQTAATALAAVCISMPNFGIIMSTAVAGYGRGRPIRCSARRTQAPTGVSSLSDTSAGIASSWPAEPRPEFCSGEQVVCRSLSSWAPSCAARHGFRVGRLLRQCRLSVIYDLEEPDRLLQHVSRFAGLQTVTHNFVEVLVQELDLLRQVRE
jgi:hypothetical protein